MIRGLLKVLKFDTMQNQYHLIADPYKELLITFVMSNDCVKVSSVNIFKNKLACI